MDIVTMKGRGWPTVKLTTMRWVENKLITFFFFKVFNLNMQSPHLLFFNITESLQSSLIFNLVIHSLVPG